MLSQREIDYAKIVGTTMIKMLGKIEENLRGDNPEIFNREDQQKLIMLATMTEKIIQERDSDPDSLISELHAMILIASSARGTLLSDLNY